MESIIKSLSLRYNMRTKLFNTDEFDHVNECKPNYLNITNINLNSIEMDKQYKIS